jgi:hypothetical protein
MGKDWMIDVLADLRSFAQQNGMMILSEQLDDTILVAAAELAQVAHGGRVEAVRHTVGDSAGPACVSEDP